MKGPVPTALSQVMWALAQRDHQRPIAVGEMEAGTEEIERAPTHRVKVEQRLVHVAEGAREVPRRERIEVVHVRSLRARADDKRRERFRLRLQIRSDE